MDGTESRVTVERLTVGLILATLVVTGPVGVDVVASGEERLGEGTASVTIVQPTAEEIRVTQGRFGSGVWYVRLPDLVVDVDGVEGRPRVQYAIAVPALGVDTTETELLTAPGRVRVPVDDRALADRPENATYRGSVRVRVQSLTAEKTVLNRTMQVTVG